MSGRSAIVRKKITETKATEKIAAAQGVGSTDSAEGNEEDSRALPLRQGRDRDRDNTGVATTHARFLIFSDPVREQETLNHRGETSGYSIHSSADSQSGGSSDGRLWDNAGASYLNRPLEDFAYARARRPTIKMEDVSGIEKSGLRTMLDKKSDEVRKGLAKTFMFGRKKDKKGDLRPASSATVRPSAGNSQAVMQPQTPGELETSGGFDGSGPGYAHETPLSPLSPHSTTGTNLSVRPWEAPAPPPAAKLPPIPRASAPPIRRWIGAGRPVQRWNKLRKDPELWDPNGDVLVFFGHKGQAPRPNPSFRLSSHILEATESRLLITLLREGSTQEEDLHMPPSPVGQDPYQHMGLSHGPGFGRGGQPTPPRSEDASLGESDGQISYEMFFPAPPGLNKTEQLRYHITTRNVFALLYHASLVGLTLFQALSDLHDRLNAYMSPDVDNLGAMLNYLSARGIDDVRNDAETAISLLAWSESVEVRWEEGWRESFLHVAGMYAQAEQCSDFRKITPITHALIERASLEQQLRVEAAQSVLAGFQYTDMWPAASGLDLYMAPARASADRLQKFLVQHYMRQYGRWPPPVLPQGQHQTVIGQAHGGGDTGDDIWLTRALVQQLQKDFAALYDFLVNRVIIWDGSEARAGRKWMMISESGDKSFEADTPDLPMTDMFIEFDNRHRFPHIPHPYPLIPDSIPPPSDAASALAGKDAQGNNLFGTKSSQKKSAVGATQGRSGASERRIQLAYTEASNICALGSDFTHSDLIDAFAKFEKTDHTGEVDPATARRGRWVLIYGVLQTLATVSVDSPNVRYSAGVGYHLSPRLKGAKIPPWRGAGAVAAGRNLNEAAHELSHCWTVPQTWNAPSSEAHSPAESSAEESRLHGSWPIPPADSSNSSVAGRGSVAGHMTSGGPGSRSLRSSVATSIGYGGMSVAGSGMSSMSAESDVPSSGMRSPTSVSSNRNRRPAPPSEHAKGTSEIYRGRINSVEEHESSDDWPRRNSNHARSSLYAPSETLEVLDDLVDESYTTAADGSGKDRAALSVVRGSGGNGSGGGFPRPLLSGTSSYDSVTPVIRDFDDLDVIDDHEP